MRLSFIRALAAQASVVQQTAPKSVSTAGKPQLRGWLGDSTRTHAVICFALSIGAAMAYRYFIGEPRKHKYAEFWRNYDEHADFKRMVKAGVYPDITVEDFESYEQEELAKLKAQYGKK